MCILSVMERFVPIKAQEGRMCSHTHTDASIRKPKKSDIQQYQYCFETLALTGVAYINSRINDCLSKL